MLVESLAAVPRWLLVGVTAGVGAAVAVAVVFLLGHRFVPATESRAGSVDGSTRRRAEIGQYLARIDERYRQQATVGGEEVAFYLPEREVVITFDPQSYHRLTAAGASAAGIAGDDPFVILAEHEMPAHHLGQRLPFETPELTPQASAARPVEAAFETLELPPDADTDRVEAAYRRQVKRAHPDQGGSREAFAELQDAYATALDHAADE